MNHSVNADDESMHAGLLQICEESFSRVYIEYLSHSGIGISIGGTLMHIMTDYLHTLSSCMIIIASFYMDYSCT